ncbi:hypothetical protein CEXT_727631 [Caerostris extrusa]|uniref:Uncharacterized protein n=1 Tax=Caerostris extrusa TaxID=172846 RepID=A0AAV4TS89_CAEEX|nr:hypothetical protein CEXT_727631 [Caerostris extrusa]
MADIISSEKDLLSPGELKTLVIAGIIEVMSWSVQLSSVADLQHSSWNLLLYPRGHANEDGYLSVFLRREKHVVHNDVDGCVTYNYATREEVFSSKRSIYLPSDTLTVRCRLWKKDVPREQCICLPKL